ncbi:7304_t:CDS:2 [Diversispora eburnea]|uniref:7304_t:CDS:1 n=1 Tax=Diversispora eburnea TaxID=1213867 RepID=A0A9N8ZJG4_9GLOM|nr:7304_t:CDS:2 [Diversispora eburnea]
MTKPNIVIVGGGYGGVNAAIKLENALHKTHQILLIERKTHFYHAFGGLRTVVEDGFENKILIPYDNMFKFGGKILHATVINIREKEIIVDMETELGTQIPFEYLIIATGSNYSYPGKTASNKKDETVTHIVAQRNAVKNAENILIIGGGPVGIAEDSSPKLKKQLVKQLTDLNVRLIFGEKIDISNIEDGLSPLNLVTNKGTQIESDVQFVAIGAKPNTEIAKTLNESIVEEGTNLIKVKPTLQLNHDEYKHIFAIGDVTNIQETKLGFRAGLQANVAANNIIALINKKKLTEYKPLSEAMLVTIGKTKGSGLLPIFGGTVVGSYMIKTLKGKDFGIPKYWKILNATLKN